MQAGFAGADPSPSVWHVSSGVARLVGLVSLPDISCVSLHLLGMRLRLPFIVKLLYHLPHPQEQSLPLLYPVSVMYSCIAEVSHVGTPC